jgi:hypothetical protein
MAVFMLKQNAPSVDNKETHKKNDFDINSLPLYDKSIEDELMNRNMAIHYQFNKNSRRAAITA